MGKCPYPLVMGPTGEELAVLANREFLLLKNSLTEKIIAHLSDIERGLHHQIKDLDFAFPEGTFLKAGKISKGEQYRSLPYFILDYPRLFTQKEVFAFRSMLWWGNEFSCTLHLRGSFLESHKTQIIDNIFGERSLYICVKDHPWEYHFEKDNYLKVSTLTKEELSGYVLQKEFLKISDYLPVTEWEQYKSFTLKTFVRFLRYLR